MIKLDTELIRKHARRLLEATVKSHTRTSKKGKPFNVKQHERDLIGKRVTFKNTIASGMSDQYGANMSGIFKGFDKETGMAIIQTKKRSLLWPVYEIPALRKLRKRKKRSSKLAHGVSDDKEYVKYK